MAEAQALRCINCGRQYPVAPVFDGCPACRDSGTPCNLTVVYDYPALRREIGPAFFQGQGLWRYARLLPARPAEMVTLHEGNTPLHRVDRIAKELGIRALYIKDESRNPAGSFKDRLCAVAVSLARRFGAQVITTSSTGNAGAAAAAYAARAGLECVIFTMASVPLPMKVSMQSYGARLVATAAAVDRWTLMEACVRQFGWYPTSNYVLPPVGANVYGLEGYKTIAYEIWEGLSALPDRVVLPVCYADGLYGVYKGFWELRELGLTEALPRLVAGEVHGPLANALAQGLPTVQPVPAPGPSVAFSIASPISMHQGLVALRESHGSAVALHDDAALLRWQQRLGREGIYAEPSACMSLAALEKQVQQGEVGADERVVCVVTATGLKDPESSARVTPAVPVVAPDLDELAATLKQVYDFTLAQARFLR